MVIQGGINNMEQIQEKKPEEQELVDATDNLGEDDEEEDDDDDEALNSVLADAQL
jgi:hypothetical protein